MRAECGLLASKITGLAARARPAGSPARAVSGIVGPPWPPHAVRHQDRQRLLARKAGPGRPARGTSLRRGPAWPVPRAWASACPHTRAMGSGWPPAIRELIRRLSGWQDSIHPADVAIPPAASVHSRERRVYVRRGT